MNGFSFVVKVLILILGVVLAASAIFVFSFYMRAPTSARVEAITGSMTFATPNDTSLGGKLSWPISGGWLCEGNDGDQFTPSVSRSKEVCVERDEKLGGTLWFSGGVNVQVDAYSDKTEIYINTNRAEAETILLRELDGTEKTLALPMHFALPNDPTIEHRVLPLASENVRIGRTVSLQSLTNQPVLQNGTASLVRESFFGEILFDTDVHKLILGDVIDVRAVGNEDFVQGVIQIEQDATFSVAITAANSEIVLHRISRDPLLINAPLATSVVRDPSIVAIWALLSLVFGGMISWLQLSSMRRGGR